MVQIFKNIGTTLTTLGQVPLTNDKMQVKQLFEKSVACKLGRYSTFKISKTKPLEYFSFVRHTC